MTFLSAADVRPFGQAKVRKKKTIQWRKQKQKIKKSDGKRGEDRKGDRKWEEREAMEEKRIEEDKAENVKRWKRKIRKVNERIGKIKLR